MFKIAVCNQKGGVGKTSTVIELASSLTQKHKKVLAVDADQQGNLSSYSGAGEGSTLYDALHAKVPVEKTIQHLKWFDLIPSDSQLSKADREFVDREDVYLLGDLLGMLSDDYDYCLIDTSPSRSILLTMAYAAADKVIIPTECDDGSLDGVNAIYEDIYKMRNGRAKITNASVLGVILTKYERTIMHSEAIKDLDEIISGMEEDPFLMTIRKSIALSECKKLEQPLQEYDKNSNPAADYRQIVNEIIKRLEK